MALDPRQLVPPETAKCAARARWQHALTMMLLVAATVLPHLPALSAGFTYDDRQFVQQNAAIRSLSSAVDSVLSPFPPEQPARGLYRPITALSYALDHQLSKDKAIAFHATSLLYYLLTVMAFYLLCLALLSSRGPALVAALFFAVHPAHAEAVDSVAGRSELLALLFSLVALLLLQRALAAIGRRRTGWIALSALSYGVAALSKETGVVLPALLALYLLLYGSAAAGVKRFFWLTPYLLVLVTYFVMRTIALGGAFGPQATVVGAASLGRRLSLMGEVFLEYGRLLLAPTVLQVDAYYERMVGVGQDLGPQALAGLALLALTVTLFASLVYRAWRSPRAAGAVDEGAARRAAALGLGALLLFLFPVLHIIPIGAVMAERFLLSPSFGFVLAAAAALEGPVGRWRAESARRGALALVLIGVLLSLFGARTHLRAREWRDGVTLWSSVEEEIKDDYRVYNNLGVGFMGRGDKGRAIQALKRSLALNPGHAPALHNLGYLYLEQGRYEAARRVLLSLVKRHPRHHLAWNSLGVLETRRNDPSRAVPHFRRALQLNPNYHAARKNLVSVQRVIDRARRFIEANSSRISTTQDVGLLRSYARACFAVGDYECAQSVPRPRP